MHCHVLVLIPTAVCVTPLEKLMDILMYQSITTLYRAGLLLSISLSSVSCYRLYAGITTSVFQFNDTKANTRLIAVRQKSRSIYHAPFLFPCIIPFSGLSPTALTLDNDFEP